MSAPAFDPVAYVADMRAIGATLTPFTVKIDVEPAYMSCRQILMKAKRRR